MFTHLKPFELRRGGGKTRRRRPSATILSVIVCWLFALTATAAPPLQMEAMNPDADAAAAFNCHAGLCGGVPRTTIVYNGDLIVAGDFDNADNIPVHGIARWDGAAWHALGEGIEGNVQALAVYDGKLIAGGVFTLAGGLPASNIAAWDGASWSPLGSGIGAGHVMSLCVHNGQLVAAGNFTSAGSHPATNIAAWDGSDWTALGSRPSFFLWKVASHYGTLVTAGHFESVNGYQVAAWNGTDWVILGASFDAPIQALTTYNGELVAGGEFTLGGARLAAWNGTAWRPLDTGLDDEIRDLTTFFNDLIAVGHFRNAGGQTMAHVARWDGTAWHALGQGLQCCGIGVVEYGNLVAVCGSFFTEEDSGVVGIAAWNGVTWRGLSSHPKSPFVIEIQRDAPTQFGGPVTVQVAKTDGSEDLHGFDLLISYDASALDLNGVRAGELFDDSGLYQWEYFQWRIDSSASPQRRIRIIALADMNNGSQHPLETTIPDGTILFNFNFTALPQGGDISMLRTPLRFYWRDCGDNIIVMNSGGDSLALSLSVYEWTGAQYNDITDPNAAFPTDFGAPDRCLDTVPNSSTSRFVNYYDGTVAIFRPTILDSRGDINVNGIANEVADFVLFYNYFFKGDSVFMYPEQSIPASDVNNDGATLRLEDLVYLERIICGDTIPVPLKNDGRQAVDSAIITQDLASRTVSVEHPDTLAALFLVFQGEIIPTFLLDTAKTMAVAEYDGIVTRLMIVPSLFYGNCRNGFASGPLFTYTGNGLLVEKRSSQYPGTNIYDYPQAADYDDDFFNHNPIRIIRIDGCGDVNGDARCTIGDAVYLIAYIFREGPPPPDMIAADVNEDGNVDLGDAVAVVNYLFRGEELPSCMNDK